MSMLTLFDVEPEVADWQPVIRHLTPEIRAVLDRFARGPVLPTDKEDWKQWAAGERCYGCGALMSKRPWTHGCGSSRFGQICDDCAALEGVGERSDGAADVSRWGIRTTPAERARLTAARERRRSRYLQEVLDA